MKPSGSLLLFLLLIAFIGIEIGMVLQKIIDILK